MNKAVVIVGVLIGVLGFTGCASVKSASGAVSESWAARYEGHSKVFETTQKETYAACKTAVDAMGFRFIRGGAAQGKLEAVSSLTTDNSLKGSRQLSFKVKLTKLPEGTEVNLLILEVVENNFDQRAGMGTETPLKASALYDLYFAQIGEAISKSKRAP